MNKLLLKFKMHRQGKSLDIFSTNSLVKKLFTIFFFAIYFVILSYLAFQFNTFSISGNMIRHIVWILILIIACWYSLKITNVNFHLSFMGVYYSLGLVFTINIYTFFTVFYTSNFTFDTWDEMFDGLYWIMPIMILNIVWKFLFAILEYKARPFFALQSLFQGIILSLVLGALGFISYGLQEYLILKEPFNYLQPFNLFMIFYGVISLITILVLSFYLNFKIEKYEKQSTKIKKTLKLWISPFFVGPLIIWFIAKVAPVTIGIQQGVLLVICLLFTSLTFLVGYNKKEVGGSSKVFLLTSTSSLLIMILSIYFFQVWWKANAASNMIIFAPFFLIILILNIVWEPPINRFYGTVYVIMSLIIAIYMIFAWVNNKVGIDIQSLPFSLGELVFIFPVVVSVILEIIVVTSYWWTISRISKYIRKYDKNSKEVLKVEE